MYSEEIKELVIKLRSKLSLSLNEITELTDIPKSTLSGWLKDYKLPNDKLLEKSRAGYNNTIITKKKNIDEFVKNDFPFMENNYTSNQKAKISESYVLFNLALREYGIYQSVFDGEKLDIIAEKNGKLIKIQVRWLRKDKYGKPLCSLRKSNGRGKSIRYENSDFDILIGYFINNNKCYVWDYNDTVNNANCISASYESQDAWHKIEEVKK